MKQVNGENEAIWRIVTFYGKVYYSGVRKTRVRFGSVSEMTPNISMAF